MKIKTNSIKYFDSFAYYIFMMCQSFKTPNRNILILWKKKYERKNASVNLTQIFEFFSDFPSAQGNYSSSCTDLPHQKGLTFYSLN